MSYASVIAADSPAYWWRCNEPGGQLSYSQFGHTWPAMVPGMPTVLLNGVPPQLGYSGIAADGGGVFVGTGQGYMSGLAFGTGAPLVAPYSIEAWVAALTWPGESYSSATTQLLLWGNVPTVQRVQIVYTGVTQQLQLAVKNNTGSDVTTAVATGAYSDGDYHHYVVTVASTGAVLYQDGVAFATTAAYTPLQYSVSPVSFGFGDSNANSSGFASGRVGTEFALYLGGLTSTQVAAHYAAREVTMRPRFKNGLASVCS